MLMHVMMNGLPRSAPLVGLCGARVILDRQRRIKVLDCGLARAFKVSEDDTASEIASYYSPEQVEKIRALTRT